MTTNGMDRFVPKTRSFQRFGSCSASSMDVGGSIPITAYHRRAASCARIKHAVTRRLQYPMHLLLFVPPPGLAHLPTQFAA
jgi:hypothetical protein